MRVLRVLFCARDGRGDGVTKKKAVKTKVRAACTRRRAIPAEACPDALRVATEEAAVPLRRAPRPGNCQRFVRREIADAMPRICAKLLELTMTGDLSALKLLLQMALDTGEVQQTGKRRTTGFARKVLASFKDWEARETEAKRDC